MLIEANRLVNFMFRSPSFISCLDLLNGCAIGIFPSAGELNVMAL
jgi:hypothetical protein